MNIHALLTLADLSYGVIIVEAITQVKFRPPGSTREAFRVAIRRWCTNFRHTDFCAVIPQQRGIHQCSILRDLVGTLNLIKMLNQSLLQCGLRQLLVQVWAPAQVPAANTEVESIYVACRVHKAIPHAHIGDIGQTNLVGMRD